jgi:DMSO/TMAO reductase YedYZ heme-binding membrane subunit
MNAKADLRTGGKRNRFQGWSLWLGISTGLLLMAAFIVAMDPTVDGVRQLIRATARTSFVLFCLAFTASAAWARFPNGWTQWQRRNRRYLGLSFATSHGIHAVAIIAFAKMDPSTFYSINSYRNIVPGTLAYMFIIAMAFTSFDRTAAWIGSRAWKALHTSGIYFLWITFFIAYAKRIPTSSLYIFPVVVLLCAFVFRIWPRTKSAFPEAQL